MDHQSPESQHDAQYWRQFLMGDQQAFEVLYHRHYQHLYNYGYGICADRDLIREGIQQLFVKLWTNRAGLQPTGYVKQYIFKAFRHHLYGLLEQQRGQPAPPSLSMPLVQDSREEKIIRGETALHTAERLQQLMTRLTPRQKEAIQLRFFENLSYEEVAQVLDMQVGAAYKLIYRALERLREAAPTAILLLYWLPF
ncbi:MAG: sigma-70 family RNA polymerase sigma factor [Candidatus Pseudobacter hemicellulosilyticus]|uniref:Sigma-70 family RNA polymerase sigma factor n=1 Tax=Candidatus Pseudobacter hemicellulosilyticus TaxID=3121375 RepID=A0AAJ5WN51_9BACT|nr:MAG: sigma-70 family RNA polymerase sigma factor [Pseudobacter sp.]